jgi:hypothetical protein
MEEPSQRITPRKMLADLDSYVATGRRADLVDALAEAIEPLYDFVIAAGGRMQSDERTFAIFHLLTRSLTDLIAAVHLASHAYLQQAHTLIRPVHENTDLIELFAQNAGEAARWVKSEKPGQEFRPADVRKRIGEPSESKDVYGHLSEMGPHPRFTGSRVAAGMRVRVDDPTDRQLVFTIGSFHEWHPASVLIYTWVFEAVIRLGFKARHLELVSDRVSRDQWVSAFLASVRSVDKGCKVLRQELQAMDAGEGTEFLDTIYDDLIAALEPGGKLADPE